MSGRFRWSIRVGVAAVAVVTLAGTALAAITWGAQNPVPGKFAWNYSNSLEFTGAPGTGTFLLHDAFVSDNTMPEATYYTNSPDGVAWSAPVKVSGTANADGSSIATAGSTVLVGWQTGFTSYDTASADRLVQVNYSTNNGATWKGVSSLSTNVTRADYPIVAAAKTSSGPVNLYVAWADADTGKIKFRVKSGAGVWSKPLTLGATSAGTGSADGFFGYTNIAATDDLVTVAWISNDKGVLKSRAINLNGVATAAADITKWTPIATLAGRISLKQNGFPIAAASPLDTGRVTIAWNTATAQVYTTYDGTTIDTTPTTIWTNGALGARTYTGGYSTVAEPTPGGGIVAGWGACKDTPLANDCDYGKNTARFDLLVSTSPDGTAFGTPVMLGDSAVKTATLNDEPSFVATSGTTYVQFNAYTASYSSYDIFTKVGTGTP